MRTKLMQLGTAAAIAALVASPSFAQTSTNPGSTAPSGTSGSPTTSSTGSSGTSNPPASHDASSGSSMNATNSDINKRDEVRVSKLVGSTVYNDQNQSVGSVDDILMTHDNKEPVQAIISVGGFLGIGSKLVEVPYDRLKLEANNKVVMPNASSDDLKKMQSFSYNTLDHSGTTNASNSSSAGTSSSSGMGAPSGAGSTTPNGATHTTTTTPNSTNK